MQNCYTLKSLITGKYRPARLLKGMLALVFTFLASGAHAQLTLLQPSDPGISLVSNNTYTVRWSRGGTSFTRVRIKLSVDGGITYPYLLVNNTPSTATDTSENITIPGVITNQARIRVTNQADSTVGDFSDNNFTISGYCWPWSMSCTNNFISNFQVNTLNNSSTCSARAYVVYSPSGTRTTNLYIGQPMAFTIKTSKTNVNMGVGIWCDLNDDQDFADAGEFLYGSSTLDTLHTGNITLPNGTSAGQHALRIRTIRGTNPGAGDFCTFYNTGGEIEDYRITAVQLPGTGPLVVRQPNASGISLTNNSTYTVRWSKGSTTYDRVQIKLSVDGGATFPYLLVNNTPSTLTDTAENIVVPGIITSQARIRVTNQNDSTIGDVSDNNFTITGYCWPWGVSCTNNFISQFSVHNLNSSSTCSARGYINYNQTRTTVLYSGQSYPFTLKTSKTNNMGVGIWCDFNGDSDFDDAGEFLYGSSSLDTSFSGSISIPSGLTLANRRLRIRAVNNHLLAANESCTFFNNGGEIEDYVVTIDQITGAGPLTILAPSATGITLTSGATSTARWARGGSDYNRVRIKFSDDGGLSFPYLLVNNTASTSVDSSENFTVPGIITTLGRIQISDQNDSTVSDISDNNFTITGYCWPWNTSCTNNFVNTVAINTLNSTSTCSSRGYINYSATAPRTTTLYTGLTYPMTIKTSKTNKMGVGVWIDFNGDQDFEDLGEFVYGSPTTDTTFLASISIPEDASLGTRRMRIRAVQNTILTDANSCTFINTGSEIEDYTVTIDQTTGVSPLAVIYPSATGISLVSNATATATWSKGSSTYDRVRIKFSTDGGATFPYTLVNNTNNLSTDTSENFTVPGYPTTTGRIRIENQLDSTQGDNGDNNFTITGYCWPWGVSCTSSHIRSVSVNTLNSSSTCGNTRAYSVFTASGSNTTTLQNGVTYPFTIRASKTSLTQGAAIYCDFNNDSDFNDAGEMLYASSSLDTTFTGSITIPNNNIIGNRRFRVRLVNNTLLGAGDACTAFSQAGEIEDYTVNFDLVPGVGPIVVRTPNNAGITLTENTTYSVSWSKGATTFPTANIKLSVDGGATFPYTLATGVSNASATNSTNITVPGLITSTARIRVANSADSTENDISDNNFAITGYCWPWGMSCSANNITNVTLNTLNRSGGCSSTRGYIVLAPTGASTTTVQRGLSYSYSITCNNANMGLGIWCDFNEDKDFDDAGEFLFGSSSLSNNFSGTLTIPPDVSTGQKRLRVRAVRSQLLTAANACTFYNTGGEIEDYTITVDQPTITITTPMADICSGTDLSVAFTTTGTFLPGNTFQVQISGPTGVFGAGTSVIGTGASSPINCHISIGTAAGTYRLRVVSSTPVPAVFGTNSASFAVRGKPSMPTSSTVSRCGTGTVTLTASGCSTMRWYDAALRGNQVGTGTSFTTPSLSSSTTYYVACIDGNGCQSLRRASTAQVTPLPAISLFAPTTGTVNETTVVIAGTGFTNLDSVVFSGGKKAVVLSSAASSINVRVPIGATTGPIRVFTRCGSVISSGTFTPVVQTVATPSFGTPGGTFSSGTTTTISTATSGASIYYTVDGSTPTPGNANTRLYTGSPVSIGSTLTIRAIATKAGWNNSAEASASFTITTPEVVATPVITPATGSYAGGQLMTITCSTPNSTIYFTLNGQVPAPGVNTPVRYIGPITLTGSETTVRAIAVRDGWTTSPVAVNTITITGGTSTLSPCTFNPPAGSFGSAQSVTISNADPLAQIYFTTDGTDPYRHLPLARPYSGPVAIPFSLTLKAQAFRDGFGDSPRTVGIYTIGGGGRMAVDGNEMVYYFENVGPANTEPEHKVRVPFSTSELNVSLTPNPSEGPVFVDFGSVQENARIIVMNALGQEISRIQTEGSSYGAAFSLQGNPAGVYLIRVVDQFGNSTDKKVVLK